MTRREFLACAALFTASRSPECGRSGDEGRLTARPGPTSASVEPGRHPLGLGANRDGLLYVPPGYAAAAPAPLVVMLHGAGGRGRISETLQALADEFKVAVLAPDSRGTTWDIVPGGVGGDVRFIDSALAYAFARCATDPARLAVAGFSDGASYALWLGTINGSLFSHIIAFSPGFLVPGSRQGSPRIFISHGRRDEILPIDDTSRQLVPRLETAGYRVVYREFDGPHAVPPAIAREAFAWLTTRDLSLSRPSPRLP